MYKTIVIRYIGFRHMIEVTGEYDMYRWKLLMDFLHAGLQTPQQ